MKLLIIALIASSFAEVAVRNFDLLDNSNDASSNVPLNFLVISQSNLGSGGLSSNDLESNRYVKVLNKKFDFVEWNSNSHIPWSVSNTTWPFHFGKQVQESTGQSVNFVIDAQGGQEIEEWLSDGGVNNGGVTANRTGRHVGLHKKISNSGVTNFHRVLFSQGEANSAFIEQGLQTIEDYGSLFLQLQSELVATGTITTQTPWIIQEQGVNSNNRGEPRNTTNQYWKTLEAPFYVMPNRSEPTIADDVHYNGDSLVRIGRFHAWRAFNGYLPVDEKEVPVIETKLSESIDSRSMFPNRVLDIDTSLRREDDTWSFRGWIDSGSSVIGGGLLRDNNGTLMYKASDTASRIETDVDLQGSFTLAGVFSGKFDSGTFYMSSNDNNVNRFSVYRNMSLAYMNGSTNVVHKLNSPSPPIPLNITGRFFVCLVRDGDNSRVYVKSSKGEFTYDLDLSPMTTDVENLQFLNFHNLTSADAGNGFYAGFAATAPYSSDQVEALYRTYQRTIPALPRN